MAILPDSLPGEHPDRIGRYVLSPDRADQLTHDLTEHIPVNPDPQENKFVCLDILGNSPYADLARNVERNVFETRFGNTPERMSEEYSPYDSDSRFFLVIDRPAQIAVGALRVICNSSSGHKTLTDIADSSREPSVDINVEDFLKQNSVELDRCWDVGTVAVLPEYTKAVSRSIVGSTLYRALYTAAVESGIEHLVAIIDEKPLGQLQRLGVPFNPMLNSGFFEYLGSDNSAAVYGKVSEFKSKMTKHYEGLNQSGLKWLGPHILALVNGDGVPERKLVQAV